MKYRAQHNILFPQTIGIDGVRIHPAPKIIITNEKKTLLITDDNLKLYRAVRLSSMSICSREILQSKHQTQAILET